MCCRVGLSLGERLELLDCFPILSHSVWFITFRINGLESRHGEQKLDSSKIWSCQSRVGAIQHIQDPSLTYTGIPLALNEVLEEIPYSNKRKKLLWKIVKAWINNCERNHYFEPTCIPWYSAPSATGYCPSRLIDVGEPKPSLTSRLRGHQRSGTKLRLVERSDFSEGSRTPRYTCLSYCWGTTLPASAKTTTVSLSVHKKAFELGDLPRTFRDAVEITRGLGIRYLWIDALWYVNSTTQKS